MGAGAVWVDPVVVLFVLPQALTIITRTSPTTVKKARFGNAIMSGTLMRKGRTSRVDVVP